MNLKPPLKWAGGKRWLLPYLELTWKQNNNRRLVEPFCGGLAITLGLQPPQALLNDINVHLINFYQQLQNGLESTLGADDNNSDLFYQRREKFNALIKQGNHLSHESALLFYYLNRTCFNGLCRFNNKGYFNVPVGRYKSINYMTTPDFAPYQGLLENWTFTSGDFEHVDLEPTDFVYADPPYDVEFTKYSKVDFEWKDQIRLVEWLKQHDGPVILSNQATERIIDLYQQNDFEIIPIEAPRRINRNGDRTPALEVLAYRNLEIVIEQNSDEVSNQLSLF